MIDWKDIAPPLDSPLLAATEVAKLAVLNSHGLSETPQPLLPSEGLDHWCERLRARVRDNYDAVILDIGSVGSGKSSLALTMARRLDPRHWTIPEGADPRHWRLPFLCYSVRSLLLSYLFTSPGTVVIFDEAVEGLMAGDQNTQEQKSIVRALSVLRARRAILFVNSPRIWLVAKSIRQGRATLWMQVLRRGLGLVHIREEHLSYRRDDELPYGRSLSAPYISWDKIEEDDPLWIAYDAEKLRQMDQIIIEELRKVGGDPRLLIQDIEARMPLVGRGRQPALRKLVEKVREYAKEIERRKTPREDGET